MYDYFTIIILSILLPHGPEGIERNSVQTIFVFKLKLLSSQVQWDEGKTYAEIAQFYARYAKSLIDYDRSGKGVVVFDGYCNSTKDHEHGNRQGLGYREVEVTANKKVMISKTKFLLNSKNKDGLIKLIIDACRELGIAGEQALSDADTLITKRAVELSTEGPVNVIANDTDILVLLIYHRQSFKNFVFLTSNEKSYDICQIASSMTDREKRLILLIHSYSGCDTVSAVFGYGKKKFLNLINDGKRVPREILHPFTAENSTKEAIQENGIKLLELMFRKGQSQNEEIPQTGKRRGRKRCKGNQPAKESSSATKHLNLGDLRLLAYTEMCAKGKIQPERLPPTEGAAAQHSLQAFLQIHDWMTLRTTSLNPLEFGWQRKSPEEVFEPIGSLEPIAPEKLRNLISCGCKTGCEKNQCSCRKNNIKCMTSCSFCRGTECMNSQRAETNNVEIDADSDSEDEN